MGIGTLNPAARKAVLILEGEDGNALVTNVYNPRFEKLYDENHVHGIARIDPGMNTLTFDVATAFQTKKSDSAREKAVSVYDEGGRVFGETEALPTFASEADLRKWMQDRHEDALQAVYLSGVLAGAEQVKFRDAHLEKEMAEIPLSVLDRVWNSLGREITAAVGKPKAFVKGLRRARKRISELRTEYAAKVPK